MCHNDTHNIMCYVWHNFSNVGDWRIYYVMATPIEPGPVFEGEDAEFLLSELSKVHVTEEERKERIEKCRGRIKERMRPKGYRIINDVIPEKHWECLQKHFLAAPVLVEENDDLDIEPLI